MKIRINKPYIRFSGAIMKKTLYSILLLSMKIYIYFRKTLLFFHTTNTNRSGIEKNRSCYHDFENFDKRQLSFLDFLTSILSRDL